MANWFMGSFQSLAARPQSAVILRNASQISLLAVVAREMSARLDDLAQPGIDALDGIGRIDHPTDRRWEGEEGHHPETEVSSFIPLYF